jgi:hypothetical protein
LVTVRLSSLRSRFSNRISLRGSREMPEAISFGGETGTGVGRSRPGVLQHLKLSRSHVGCFHSRPGTSALVRSKLLARQEFSRRRDLYPNFINVAAQVRGL